MLDKHLIAKTQPLPNGDNIVFFDNYRITVLSDRLFRVEKSGNKEFNDYATQSVWFRNSKKVEYEYIAKNNCIKITTKKVSIVINKDYEKSYVIIDGKKVKPNNKENLKGTFRTLDQYDGNYNIHDKNFIELGEGVCSKNGVAVFDDSKSLIYKEDGTMAKPFNEMFDLYVFCFGFDYKNAVKALYSITGNTPLIPRYALGNWWSRYHSYTDEEYLNILKRLRNRNIPITVATIDMDWHYSNNLDAEKKITESGKNTDFYGGNSGWTGYSWNKNLFKDYKSFLNEIKKNNYKITLNLHPAGGVRWFEDCYKQFAISMGMDYKSEKHIPFDLTDENFINNYFKVIHKPYEKDGVEFWWIDWQQGVTSKIDGLDPLWLLNHFHYLDNALNHRPLILSRYAGVGSHRYPLGFSGDVVISWESLDFIPYFTLTATNIGYTWWSHDIGGHFLGIKDDELYLRYIQFGVFSPINRLHCTWEEVINKEPCFYSNGTGFIAEEFLRFRHRIIPFVYSQNYKNHLFGDALIEPLYYYEPKEKNSYKYKNEYYFGKDFLVCPITHKSKKGLSKLNIYFPDGKWTDIFTNEEYIGGTEKTIVRWLDTMPVFAKEGAVMPMYDKIYDNSIENPKFLCVDIYNGDNTYDMYEDNDNDKVMITKFALSHTKGKQKVEITFSGDTEVITERNITLNFKNIVKGKFVLKENDKIIESKQNSDGYLSVEFLINTANKYTIEVEFIEKTKLDKIKFSAYYTLNRMEGNNADRFDLYNSIKDVKNEKEYLNVIDDFFSKKKYSLLLKKRYVETL